MRIDRRITKTQQAIRKSFFDLLSHKKINEVTVADITKRADIARSTFYLHYEDVYDLYDQIINNLLSGLTNRFDRLYPASTLASNFKNLMQELINYVAEQKSFFQVLFKKDSENKLTNNLINLFTRRILKIEKITQANKQAYFEILFTVTGAINIFINWLMRDSDTVPYELSNILNQILIKLE
jgi:AcrR family transcriptional regulator